MRAIGMMLGLLLAVTAGAVAAAEARQQPEGARAEARQAAEDINQWLDDRRITTQIKGRLIADTEVDGRRINVDTHSGRVTLYGTVTESAVAERAVQLARNTEGVQGVESRLNTLRP